VQVDTVTGGKKFVGVTSRPEEWIRLVSVRRAFARPKTIS